MHKDPSQSSVMEEIERPTKKKKLMGGGKGPSAGT